MIKIYHVPRDYTKLLDAQIKELKKEYKGFEYLWTDGAHGDAKIHFVEDEK